MTQYHYVVFFDDKSNKWKVDYPTTSARFPDGTIWNGKEWEGIDVSPHADIEEEIFGELNEILESANNNKVY